MAGFSLLCPLCKATLKLKMAPPAGKKLTCPKCQKPFKVPAPHQPESSESLAHLNEDDAVDDSPEEEEEEDEVEQETPEKSARRVSSRRKTGGTSSRKSNFNVVPWILGGIGVLVVLAGIGVVGYLALTMLPQAKNKLDMAYLPDDCREVVYVQVSKIYDAPAVQPALKNPMFAMQDAVGQAWGINFRDIQSITVGATGALPTGTPMNMQDLSKIDVKFVAVIRSGKPFDEDKLKKALSLQNGEKYLKFKAPSGGKALGFFFPKPEILVVGSEAEIEVVSNQGERQKRRADLDFINPDHQIIYASVMEPGASPQPIPASVPAEAKKLLESMQSKAKAHCLTVDVTSSVSIELTAVCTDTATAEGLLAEANTALDTAKKEWERFKPFLGPAAEPVDAIVKSISPKVNSETNSLQVSISIPESALKLANGEPPPVSPEGGLPGELPGLPAGLPTDLPGVPAGIPAAPGSPGESTPPGPVELPVLGPAP